jgi:hypothetical protein
MVTCGLGLSLYLLRDCDPTGDESAAPERVGEGVLVAGSQPFPGGPQTVVAKTEAFCAQLPGIAVGWKTADSAARMLDAGPA